MSIQEIPLSKLRISPVNMRKAKDGTDLDSLAETIYHQGLLQNLVVIDADKGRFEVVAGERRFLAMKNLQKAKRIPAGYPVACRIVPAARAKEASLVENKQRVSHHPADEFDAIASIVEAEPTATMDEVAARLGMTVKHVRQRWKLARVSPALFQLYRDGAMTLDQLQAFTVSDDHARQERAWHDHPYARHPHGIRLRLVEGNVHMTDRRVLFVGLDAYEQAGGQTSRDLFGEDVWVMDRPLLDKLAGERLASLREAVLGEGWKWVEIVDGLYWQLTQGLLRVYPKQGSPQDQERLEQLYSRWEEMVRELGEKPENPDDAAEMAELVAEIGRLEALAQTYQPDDVARGGAFIYINNDGEAKVDRGWVRPEPKPDPVPVAPLAAPGGGTAAGEGEGGPMDPAPALPRPAAAPEPDDAGEEDEKPKPLPPDLVEELTAERTMALQVMVAQNSHVALVALVHALTADALHTSMDRTCLNARVTDPGLARFSKNIADSKAGRAMREMQEEWGEVLHADHDSRWTQLMQWDDGRLLDLLAFCVAQGGNAVRGRWDNDKSDHIRHANVLSEAVGLDMADWWEVTPANYLNRVTKAHIAAAVAEARGKEEAGALAGMKKIPMVAVAARQLEGTRWLPEVISLRVGDKVVKQPVAVVAAKDGEREAA